MRLIEAEKSIIGSRISTYSLRVIGFSGLTKRLQLAAKIKPTTTDLLFEDSSLDDILEFFRWFNHVKPDFLNSERMNKDLSPRVCDDELLDEEQNRLESIYNLEFTNCILSIPHSRLNVEIISLFRHMRSIKFYNCTLDEILSVMMLDHFKSLTSLHTISFIGCELSSIVIAKLMDLIENNLGQIAILELKQTTQVTSLVEKKIEDTFLRDDASKIFPCIMACNVSFEKSELFSAKFTQNILENGLLTNNRNKISWMVSCIHEFINDDHLPFDEYFFKTFFNCRAAIFQQLTSPAMGLKMLNPFHVSKLFDNIVNFLWEKFFSRYLEREEGIYLESRDLFEISAEKLFTGDTSGFNEVIDDLLDLTSDKGQLLSYLKDLLQIATDKKRHFPQEYLKKSIEICKNQMDISIAYS